MYWRKLRPAGSRHDRWIKPRQATLMEKWGKKNSSVFFTLGHQFVSLQLHNNSEIHSHADMSYVQIDSVTGLRVARRPPLRMRVTSGPANCWWRLNWNANNRTMRPIGALRPSVWARVSSVAAWTHSVVITYLGCFAHIHISCLYSCIGGGVVNSALQLSARRSECGSRQALFIYFFPLTPGGILQAKQLLDRPIQTFSRF